MRRLMSRLRMIRSGMGLAVVVVRLCSTISVLPRWIFVLFSLLDYWL